MSGILSRKKLWLICAGIYFFSQIFFLLQIQIPSSLNFDEFHYVPAAKNFLALKDNHNHEHPPLGKELVAIGIGAFGDRPIGWRFMSTVFGSLTLVGFYLLALNFFRSSKIALWVVFLTLANQLLYVQARIAMLDTFHFTFLVWGLVFFIGAWDIALTAKTQKKYLYACGVMFGLALACKWFAIVPLFFCATLVAVLKLFQYWGLRFKNQNANDWYQEKLFLGIKLRTYFIAFIGLPLLAYYSTYLPFLFFSDAHYSIPQIVWQMQKDMWNLQHSVPPTHSYASPWSSWAILKRPIWYAYETIANKQIRGVLLLGNPLIMWGGLVALLFVAVQWVRDRNRSATFILFSYLMLYLSWVILQRQPSFYYYYYPAGMFLSFVLAQAFWNSRLQKLHTSAWIFLGLAVLLFYYFFPLLAALKMPENSYRSLLWFNSWI